MFNKLFGKLSGDSRKKGFTMTELLTVVGIIAIVCAIAIPAIISMNKSLKFKQANEYAESIFMAAQANLTEMRSDGQLINLLTDDNGAEQIPSNVDFPEDHVANYRYATSEDPVYNVLVPKMSVDSEVRDGNVLIEYNPFTGNVYAVFYKDGGETLSYGNVSRDEDARRDLLLGYYCGSALSTEPLTPEETEAEINFDNGEEGIVEVSIPIPKSYKSRVNDFAHGLAVDLTVKGATLEDTDRNGKTGSFTVQIKQAEPNDRNWKWDAAENKIIVSYTLDSLMDKQSFANYCQRSGEPIKKAPYAHVQAKSASNETGTEKSLTAIADESAFNIYPGENINISAEVTFKPSAEKASVNISTGSFDNANPMFGMLVPADGGDGYVLCVSNGRNLQNLNAIAPKIANKIKTVAFTGDIDWNNTVTYYNNKAANGSYVNDSSEAPARALPYFVPIHNENLFGTAQFVYPGDGNGLWAKVIDILQKIFNTNLNQKSDVPTLTDELDIISISDDKTYKTKNHATVSGNGHKVLNIKIDSTQYALGADFYAGKTASANTDRFTGLFGYVNTSIDGLSVVNPIIKGGDFSGNNNPATGALVGAAGFNTLITNCSTYIDTSTDSGFNRSVLHKGATKQFEAFKDESDTNDYYGVEGNGAVGGLVGYAKSHRTVTGELTSDKKSLAFSNCSASIPVSGHMRGADVTGTNGKHYGYTNGVGGLVGNAEISNFYNCYASGDVVADGIYVDYLKDISGKVKEFADKIAAAIGVDPPDLFYNGRTSIGAGGFVGTSHGVRYTNCFASGDVIGENCSKQKEAEKKGAAGFTGIMSYEETHLYGNDKSGVGDKTHADIAQMTVFQNCYAVGTAKSLKNGSSEAASIAESFSGANCRIKFDGFAGTATKYWGGSYYQTYAPWWYGANGDIVNGIERLPYQSFIFKDSYYISKYTTLDKDQTNACASPLMYESFEDLTGMQNDPEWQKKQIEVIKGISTSGLLRLLGDKASGDDDKYAPTRYNFGGIYFGEWLNEDVVRDVDNWFESLFFEEYSGKRYAAPRSSHLNGPKARNILSGRWLTGFPECVRTKGYIANHDEISSNDISPDNYMAYYSNTLDDLEGIYTKLYKEGFSSDYWQAGGKGKTFAYDETALNQNAKYPFTKLNGLDYYGRWPARQIACGIAYYEQYGKDDYGYYFDRAGTSTLQDKPVISDGYAILTGSQTDDVRIVEINGQKKVIKLNTTNSYYTATYTTGDSVYCVYRLPWEALQQASSDSFYTEIKVTVNDEKTYTLYFNPNVALSQVNPEDKGDKYPDSKFTAKEPETLPAQVYIRSARQLAALGKSTMNAYTANENINFVQQLDIDASKYTGASYETPNTVANAVKKNASVASFGAAYTGKTASEKSPIISGFANPIFTVIGETGSVSDLAISCSGKHGSTAVNEAGVLAGINKGTVTNVDVTVAGASSVKAKTTAGLLIGVNSGTVSHCDATVSAEATVTAGTNAGGIIGVNIGTVEKCTANITGTMTVNATNAGGFVGAALEGSKFEDVTVNGSNITGNGSVGAFAGSLEKTNADSVTVTVNGTVRATDTAAGFAASVNGDTITGSTVTIAKGAAVSAKSAAGLIGTANAANLSGLKLDLKGSVTGTDSAVGAVTKITRGTTSSVNVVLNGGTISATAANGNAAGFTLDAVTHIELCNVSGEGTISANAANGSAAGFAVSVSENDVFNCIVSPADHTKTNLKNAYRASELAGLTISATGANGNAAGFAVNVSGTITNSSALGTISGTNAAGFAVNVENSGSINACMANTDLVYNTGSPFAKTNSGLVANSYAWYKNGAVQNIDLDEGQAAHYSSCYFAPFRSTEPKPKPVTVVKGRAVEQISYEALAALEPEALGGESTVWQFAGKDDAYPFTNMRGAQYAYPMLHDHYGDWENPTQYPYGVVYYEKNGDSIVSMDLVDLSDVQPSYSLKKLAGDNTNITETGYAVFYHKQNQTQIVIDGDGSVADYDELAVDDLTGLELGDEETAKIAKFLKDYEFRIWPETQYAKAKQGIVINGLDGGKHMIVPAYADAIIKDWTAETAAETATYEIRTANQFANINAELGLASIAKGYEQTHSFTLSGNSNIETFKSLSYDGGGHEITVGAIKHGLFGAVSGTAVIRNVKLTGAVLTATKTAGIVADTVGENGTIKDVTLSKPRIEISADYTKDNNTIAIGAVAGTNEGTITKIKVETSKLTDIAGKVQKDAGEVMYIPFVIDASKTTLKNVALNLNIGGLVGSNTGTLKASDVETDIEFTPVTAAPGADDKPTNLSQNVSFGGLAGYNTKTVEGTVTGDISLGSVALDNDGKEVTLTDDVKLGGLVGCNYKDKAGTADASVTGTVTGNISYTRPAVVSDNENATVDGESKTVTDNVMLGGLVGCNYKDKAGTADASVTGTFAGKATETDETDKTIAIVKAQDVIVDETDTSKNTYVLDASVSGKTYIGGLVGQMNGGSMSGGAASGAITVTGDETYVGGAIGYEMGTTSFNNVKTEVDIKGSWSNTKHDNSVDCPSGYANIGKFVGYVTGGKFTDCRGLGNSNLALQFLGSIEKKGTPYSNLYKSSVKLTANTTVEKWPTDGDNYKDNSNNLFKPATSGTYYKFTASLDNCTYKSSNDGKEYTQYIKDTDYFYTMSNHNAYTQYTAGESKDSMDSNNDYIIVDNTGKWALTANGSNIGAKTLASLQEYNGTSRTWIEDESTIWTYEGTNRLRNNTSNITEKYMKLERSLISNVSGLVSDATDGQFGLYASGGYVYFRTYCNSYLAGKGYWYLSCDKDKGGTGLVEGNNSDSTKFKIYLVSSTDFERATMTYNAFNRVCTSNEP